MKKIFLLLLLVSINNVVAKASDFKINQISDDLGTVWGMTFIDDKQIIFTERNGRCGLLNTQTGQHTYLKGLPEVLAEGQGGLLDVAVPNDFIKGDWIYFTYSKNVDWEGATTLARAKLKGQSIVDWSDLLVTKSVSSSGRHYGSRIAFDNEGHVYFSVGDRGDRPNGQNLKTHAGSIIRLNRDGSIPTDNPFVNQANALPEIWSYGHRNPQGLTWDTKNQRLWSNEHGPRGGDEINLIEKGNNYGWPTISYGKEYWGPISVGESTHKKGMEQPIKFYDPSIAPGSLLMYSGKAFPNWQGDLFAGALKLRHLNRVSLNQQGQTTAEDRLLEDLNSRIRALAQSPEGYIYFSTDSGNVYQMVPK